MLLFVQKEEEGDKPEAAKIHGRVAEGSRYKVVLYREGDERTILGHWRCLSCKVGESTTMVSGS